MRENTARTERATDTTDDGDDTLRVLRIVTDAYPEVLGGGALHAHLMSKRQSEIGHQVVMVTSDHGDETRPREEHRDGYTIKRHHEWGRPFGNSITPGLVRTLVDREDEYDIVHAHSHLYFSSNVAAALARVNDVPFVITNHGLVSQTAPAWTQRLYLPTVARFTLNSADRVFCYTTTDHDRLRQRNVTAPISVINNGIDCTQFRPDRGTDRRNQLLFVGRLNESKGVDRLFDAFVGLSEDLEDVTLEIVGEGPLYECLSEERSKHGLEDRVNLAGRLPNHELPRVYNESSVFVLPSSNEGMPRTVLEALACEVPVITSALPQLEPVVDGAGFTVPRGATHALETAIRRLLRDATLREDMGTRGRKRTVEHYSWENTVRETTREYYQVIDENE
jgi:glycosyltransferase involved in cell wall biosynthesis